MAKVDKLSFSSRGCIMKLEKAGEMVSTNGLGSKPFKRRNVICKPSGPAFSSLGLSFERFRKEKAALPRRP